MLLMWHLCRSHVRGPKYGEVVKAAPDVFEVLPKAFDKRYKNPCWMQVNV